MLEHLIAAIMGAWEKLAPLFVVNVYGAAAVLRFGHFHHAVGPGLHWKLPLVDDIMHEYVVMTTLRLQPQTCTTKDRKDVVVAGVLKYRLAEIEPYVCGVIEQKDALIDIAMGAVLTHVRALTFDELVDEPPESKIASSIRRQVSKFGFEILTFTFTDMGQVRSLRLITHTPVGIIGEQA